MGTIGGDFATWRAGLEAQEAAARSSSERECQGSLAAGPGGWRLVVGPRAFRRAVIFAFVVSAILATIVG